MATATIHTLYGIECASTVVGGVGSLDIGNDVSLVEDASSGEAFNRFIALQRCRTVGNLQSKSVAALLAQSTLLGASIASMSGGLKLYGYKAVDGGLRAGATSHRKFTVNKGLLVPRPITVTHPDDAVMSAEIACAYNGTNLPIVETDSQSVPSGLTDAERFGIGPVTLESVAISQITSLTIDPGVTYELVGSDGDEFETFVWVPRVTPRITIRSTNILEMASGSIPYVGLALTHANTAVYLRKRALGGQWVADETEEHIKFTLAGMAYVSQPFRASNNAAAEIEIVCVGRYDGTNNPLTVDTTAALP